MADAELIDFFLAAPPEVVALDLVEVTHPSFVRTYRLVRNSSAGVTVTLPGSGLTTFDYRPIRIERSGSSDDLTQAMRLDLGDPGSLLSEEVHALVTADTIRDKPRLRYWCYRSDDLVVPIVGPLVYEVVSLSQKGSAVSMEVSAPERNASGTGELLTFDRFPMQRGFI